MKATYHKKKLAQLLIKDSGGPSESPITLNGLHRVVQKIEKKYNSHLHKTEVALEQQVSLNQM